MNIKTATAVGKASKAMESISNAISSGDVKGAITDAHQNANKVNPIEFHNYNYPPLFRLYHYPKNGVGVKEPAKSIIKKMCIAANLIVFLSFVNFFNNIIQMSSDCKLIKATSVAYSIFSKFKLTFTFYLRFLTFY